MHDASLDAMAKMLLRIPDWAGKLVLDVGSRNINGSYRSMVELLGATYTGLDIVKGENVDVVTSLPYTYPFEDESFDGVICGNMLHQVPHPWQLFSEMVRVLKPGGLLAVVTVWKWGEASYPEDYFRFMPMGLYTLFADTGCFEMAKSMQLERYDDGTLAGSAVKR